MDLALDLDEIAKLKTQRARPAGFRPSMRARGPAPSASGRGAAPNAPSTSARVLPVTAVPAPTVAPTQPALAAALPGTAYHTTVPAEAPMMTHAPAGSVLHLVGPQAHASPHPLPPALTVRTSAVVAPQGQLALLLPTVGRVHLLTPAASMHEPSPPPALVRAVPPRGSPPAATSACLPDAVPSGRPQPGDTSRGSVMPVTASSHMPQPGAPAAVAPGATPEAQVSTTAAIAAAAAVCSGLQPTAKRARVAAPATASVTPLSPNTRLASGVTALPAAGNPPLEPPLRTAYNPLPSQAHAVMVAQGTHGHFLWPALASAGPKHSSPEAVSATPAVSPYQLCGGPAHLNAVAVASQVGPVPGAAGTSVLAAVEAAGGTQPSGALVPMVGAAHLPVPRRTVKKPAGPPRERKQTQSLNVQAMSVEDLLLQPPGQGEGHKPRGGRGRPRAVPLPPHLEPRRTPLLPPQALNAFIAAQKAKANAVPGSPAYIAASAALAQAIASASPGTAPFSATTPHGGGVASESEANARLPPGFLIAPRTAQRPGQPAPAPGAMSTAAPATAATGQPPAAAPPGLGSISMSGTAAAMAASTPGTMSLSPRKSTALPPPSQDTIAKQQMLSELATMARLRAPARPPAGVLAAPPPLAAAAGGTTGLQPALPPALFLRVSAQAAKGSVAVPSGTASGTPAAAAKPAAAAPGGLLEEDSAPKKRRRRASAIAGPNPLATEASAVEPEPTQKSKLATTRRAAKSGAHVPSDAAAAGGAAAERCTRAGGDEDAGAASDASDKSAAAAAAATLLQVARGPQVVGTGRPKRAAASKRVVQVAVTTSDSEGGAVASDAEGRGAGRTAGGAAGCAAPDGRLLTDAKALEVPRSKRGQPRSNPPPPRRRKKAAATAAATGGAEAAATHHADAEVGNADPSTALVLVPQPSGYNDGGCGDAGAGVAGAYGDATGGEAGDAVYISMAEGPLECSTGRRGQEDELYAAAGVPRFRLPVVDLSEEVDASTWTLRKIIAKVSAEDRIARDEQRRAARAKTNVAAALRITNGETGAPSQASEAPATPAPTPRAQSHAPRMTMVDGRMVLDTGSLVVQAQQVEAQHYERVEHSGLVNSLTHGRRGPSESWTPKTTELFFRALSQYGTDFEKIAKLYPKRTRAQIKAKFKREMKAQPGKVNDALYGEKRGVDERDKQMMHELVMMKIANENSERNPDDEEAGGLDEAEGSEDDAAPGRGGVEAGTAGSPGRQPVPPLPAAACDTTGPPAAGASAVAQGSRAKAVPRAGPRRGVARADADGAAPSVQQQTLCPPPVPPSEQEQYYDNDEDDYQMY